MGRGHPTLFAVAEKSPNHDPHWPARKGRNGSWSNPPWPLLNVWLGVSVEDQKRADERIPQLLQTPATVRWVSAEPLLGAVNAAPYMGGNSIKCGCGYREDEGGIIGALQKNASCIYCGKKAVYGPTLDWVVVGGESGPGARPLRPIWARRLRDQCRAAGVPFFFKQWGEWAPRTWGEAVELPPPDGDSRLGCFTSIGKFAVGMSGSDLQNMARVGKKQAGRLLDGREWSEFPAAVKCSTA